MRQATPLAIAASLVLLGSGVASAGTFVVTSAGDTPFPPAGPKPCTSAPASCTLRAAIVEGNNSTGPHTITFAVPKVTLSNGGGLALQAPFVITGNSALRTIIDGGGLGCFTLTDASSALNPKGANGTVISYLSIQHCSGDAISANGHGFKFVNNHIGTDVTGLLANASTANTGHGISVSSSRVYVAIDSAAKVNTFLKDVYTSFPFPLPDLTLPDVSGQINKFSTNLVTALAALTDPVFITNNVISGNGQNGIEIFSENLAGVIIAGNMIGTDATGNSALPNGKSGVHFTGNTFGNLVGPGNVISGNKDHGVRVDSSTLLLPNFIMGNRIGLGVLATAKVGNQKSGVSIADARPSTAAAGYNAASLSIVVGNNVISGNLGDAASLDPDTLGADEAGIVITATSTKVKVVGNTIGIGEFPAPAASTAHGNAGDGIIITTSNNTIGGASAGEANIIAGNVRHGLVVKLSGTAGNDIRGNYIGVHPGLAGTWTIGNGKDGIHINGANATTVGGPGNGERNIIAANKRHGIALRNGGTANGWANLFQRNLIFKNSVLGIDLDHPRNGADDPNHGIFPTNYPNLDQNQPAICTSATGPCVGFTAPSSTGGVTKLDWTLDAKPSAKYRLEFFRLDAATQAASTTMTFLGEQTVSANSTGALIGCTAAGRCTSTIASPAAGYIVMTATDITTIVIGPANPTWLGLLECVALKTCTVDSTSELSNVAPVVVPAGAPIAVTTAATAVTATSATLNGTVTASNSPTTAGFVWGLTASYGTSAAATPASFAANAFQVPVTASVSGLTCGTTYHFRIEAKNGIGADNGEDVTFTTMPCPTPDAGPTRPDAAGTQKDAGATSSPDAAPVPAETKSGCQIEATRIESLGLGVLVLVAFLVLTLRRRRSCR